MSALRDTTRFIVNGIFTESCVHCCKRVAEEGLLCHACSEKICVSATPPHRGIYSVYSAAEYSGALKSLFAAAKFSERYRALHMLSRYAENSLGVFAANDTLFVAMPSSHKFLKRLLSKTVGKDKVFFGGYRMLSMRDSNKTLGEAERFRRIQESLVLSGKRLPHAERYVLCDDVLTTGATLNRAAWLLEKEREVPREKIYLWSLLFRRRRHEEEDANSRVII